MSQKNLKRDREFKIPDVPAKRIVSNKSYIEPSEDLLWSETDDSLFSNSKLDQLIGGEDGQSRASLVIHSLDANESVFRTINMKSPCEENVNINRVEESTVGSVWSREDFSKGEDTMCEAAVEDDANESIFRDIDLKELASGDGSAQDEDDNYKDIGVQNTQKFLHDVSMVSSKLTVPTKKAQVFKSKSIRSNIAGDLQDLVHGSQYTALEEKDTRLQRNRLPFNRQGLVQPMPPLPPKKKTGNITTTDINMSTYYGLPRKVHALITEHKGFSRLYDWQNECLNLPAIKLRRNLIYALPTSGGKTLVAEILMLREIICRKKNVLFILPYVSIVQEKVSSLLPFAVALDFLVDEYTAGKGKCPPTQHRKRKNIFIASIEKGAILLDSLIDANRANEIGLVVIDELHLIGEKGRGAILEGLLTKVMFLHADIQIIGMSATIGNLAELSKFLKADVYRRGFRPVELREYIKCGKDILEINPSGEHADEIFTYKRTVDFKYSKNVAHYDPDHLAGMVSECSPHHCCLIFCPSRKNCENVALLLSRTLPKSTFYEHRKHEKVEFLNALKNICGVLSPILAKTIPYGIAYHHSGLITDERKLLEDAYRLGVLCVICCTSTLAAGVNLPAKRVIIRAPYVGTDFITLGRYKQMVGRAGRAGMGEAGESILITNSQDNVRVATMLFSPMDKALSSLLKDDFSIQNFTISAIGLGLANSRNMLRSLFDTTLVAMQLDHMDVNDRSVPALVLRILSELFKYRVVKIANADDGDGDDSDDESIKGGDTQNVPTAKHNAPLPLSNNGKLVGRIRIGKNTPIQLTTIGRAAFKAGIDHRRTHNICNELFYAQKQLLLRNYSHLLYLIVSFNSNDVGDEMFAANAGILFRIYSDLDPETLSLFHLLGITEAHAAKLAKTLSIQGPMELKLNRLFKVLILLDAIAGVSLPAIAIKYDIERGLVQNIVAQATSAASAMVRLCDQIDEFWCFMPLLERVAVKLDRGGTKELEQLLELPAVKMNRAKQLYKAGLKTIEDIARCNPVKLSMMIDYLPHHVGRQIIAAAKMMLLKKLDHLEGETEIIRNTLK